MTWQWSMNMIKTMWCRFQPCSGTFPMLLLEGSSQTRIFRHLSNYVFRARNFGKTRAFRVIFSSKMFEIESRFQKWSRKLRKLFCFWDNCIWIGIPKLSLLRTGHFSSVAYVLTSSTKISHVNNRDFFQLHLLGSDQSIW